MVLYPFYLSVPHKCALNSFSITFEVMNDLFVSMSSTKDVINSQEIPDELRCHGDTKVSLIFSIHHMPLGLLPTGNADPQIVSSGNGGSTIKRKKIDSLRKLLYVCLEAQ